MPPERPPLFFQHTSVKYTLALVVPMGVYEWGLFCSSS